MSVVIGLDFGPLARVHAGELKIHRIWAKRSEAIERLSIGTVPSLKRSVGLFQFKCIRNLITAFSYLFQSNLLSIRQLVRRVLFRLVPFFSLKYFSLPLPACSIWSTICTVNCLPSTALTFFYLCCSCLSSSLVILLFDMLQFILCLANLFASYFGPLIYCNTPLSNGLLPARLMLNGIIESEGCFSANDCSILTSTLTNPFVQYCSIPSPTI